MYIPEPPEHRTTCKETRAAAKHVQPLQGDTKSRARWPDLLFHPKKGVVGARQVLWAGRSWWCSLGCGHWQRALAIFGILWVETRGYSQFGGFEMGEEKELELLVRLPSPSRAQHPAWAPVVGFSPVTPWQRGERKRAWERRLKICN